MTEDGLGACAAALGVEIAILAGSATGADLPGSPAQGEALDGGPPTAERYRVEVHDWSGPPALPVALALTFYGGVGVAGT